MRFRPIAVLVALAALFGAQAAAAQMTRTLDPGMPSPPASIDQLAWLAGQWRGADDEGTPAIESWQGPYAGVMTGSFIQTRPRDGETAEEDWIEFMLIAPRGDSLGFSMGSYLEEGVDAPFTLYRLVAIEGCTAYFHQVTFQCEREDGEIVGLTVYWEATNPESGEQAGPYTYRYKRAD